jgi:hypothetical protein
MTPAPIDPTGAARDPVLPLPFGATNTPYASVTTHGSVGGSLARWHAPAHSKYGEVHVKPHVLDAHVAVALATLVVHVTPHPPQLLRFDVVSTHAPASAQ